MQSKPLVKQVVLVAIPGLDAATRKAQAHCMPCLHTHFPPPSICKMDNGKATFAASFDRIVVVPPSAAQRKKQQQARQQAEAAGTPPPQPPSAYALTLEQMNALNYPMPVRSATPCRCGQLCWKPLRPEKSEEVLEAPAPRPNKRGV